MKKSKSFQSLKKVCRNWKVVLVPKYPEILQGACSFSHKTATLQHLEQTLAKVASKNRKIGKIPLSFFVSLTMFDQKIDYLQLGCHYVPCHPKHIKCLHQNCQRLAFLNAPVEAPQETSAFALAGFVGLGTWEKRLKRVLRILRIIQRWCFRNPGGCNSWYGLYIPWLTDGFSIHFLVIAGVVEASTGMKGIVSMWCFLFGVALKIPGFFDKLGGCWRLLRVSETLKVWHLKISMGLLGTPASCHDENQGLTIAWIMHLGKDFLLLEIMCCMVHFSSASCE